MKKLRNIIKESKNNMKTWYEVFISAEFGTRTLEIFDTLPQAKKYIKNFEGNSFEFDCGFVLHIDQWENASNPKKIRSII